MHSVMTAGLSAQGAQGVSTASQRHQMPLSFLKSGETATIAKVRGKGPFGVLAISVLQLALMAVFLPSMVTSGAVYIAVLLTSAVVAILHQLVIKKTGWKWLGNFVMADSLICLLYTSPSPRD